MTIGTASGYGAIAGSIMVFLSCATYQRWLLAQYNSRMLTDKKQVEEKVATSFFREFMQIARIALPTAWCKEFFGTLVFILLFFVMAVFRVLTSNANGKVLHAMTEGSGSARLQNFTRMLLLRTALYLLSSVCSSCVEHLRTWLIGCYRVRLSQHFQKRYYSSLTFYRATVLDKRLEDVDSVITTYCAEFAEHFAELPYYFLLPLLGSATSLFALVQKVGGCASAAACGLIITSVLLMKKLSPPFGRIYASLLSQEDSYRRMLSNSLINVENIALHKGGGHTERKLEGRLSVLKDALNHFALARGYFNLLELAFSTSLRNIASVIVFGDALRRKEASVSDIYVELLYLRDLSKSVSDVVSNLREISHLSTYTLKLADFDTTLKSIEQDVRETVTEEEDGKLSSPAISSPAAPSEEGSCFPLFKFSNVTLETPAGHVLFENLNLCMESDQDWVIIGGNGLGKTSLLRLISGLWSPLKGTFTMNRRVNLLFAPQQSYMVPQCTLLEQLVYPEIVKSVSEEDVERAKEALRLAGAGSVVEVLGGFDSAQVGFDPSNVDDTYDWASLSGGQKQRVNMARVFYQILRMDRSREVPVALLDEATSMMDDTEKEVMHNMQKLKVRMISVTHREQVIRRHTHVLKVLPEGRWTASVMSLGASSDNISTQGEPSM